MRALHSSLGAWDGIERSEGIAGRHGLTFALAVVEAIGRPHGLVFVDAPPADALFLSVYDSRCMMATRSQFDAFGVPMRRAERAATHPLVWAGGQGLHNPMPYYDVADIIVIGDAEQPLPTLLHLWERHGNGRGFLAAASTVPGVLVPAHHDPSEATVEQSVSADIGITVRELVSVSHIDDRRIEIARGCKFRCMFCGLGWRAPYRENPTSALLDALNNSPRTVHLQAGDAESHSGIRALRTALTASGRRDNGWTGRADTAKCDDVAGSKRFAFGVEAMSERVRLAIGKRLTDSELERSTLAALDGTAGDSKGRLCWHMISGLPGACSADAVGFVRMLTRISDARRGKTARNLSLHWQPFQPLPGTPMQWCACGGGARRDAGMLRGAEHMPWVRVRSVAGRTDDIARVCTVISRSGRRGADLLDVLGDGRVTPDDAALVSGSCYGAIPIDTELPWDWIRHHHRRAVLERGHSAMIRRLT